MTNPRFEAPWFRLDADSQRRVTDRAEAEGISEDALVTRLVDEGLKMAAHPGVVYRDGPSGRRAGLAGGPDVWEVILAVQRASGHRGAEVSDAAKQTGLPERLVQLAMSFAAAHAEEIQHRIALNEAAAERARELAAQRERLLAP